MTTLTIRAGLSTGVQEYVSLVPWRFGAEAEDRPSGFALWYDGNMWDDPAPNMSFHKDTTEQRHFGYVRSDQIAPIEFVDLANVHEGDVIVAIKTDAYGYAVNDEGRRGYFALVKDITHRHHGGLAIDTTAINLMPASMEVTHRDGRAEYTMEVGGPGLDAFRYVYTGHDLKIARLLSVSVEQDSPQPYVPTSEHVRDMEILTEVLTYEANARNWCNEYDQIVDRLNERLTVKMGERSKTLGIWFGISGSNYIRLEGGGIEATVTVHWQASFYKEFPDVDSDADPDDVANDYDVTEDYDEWTYDTYGVSIDGADDATIDSAYELRDAIAEDGFDGIDVEVTDYEWK